MGEEEKINSWGSWTLPMSDSLTKFSVTSGNISKLFSSYLDTSSNKISDKKDDDKKDEKDEDDKYDDVKKNTDRK